MRKFTLYASITVAWIFAIAIAAEIFTRCLYSPPNGYFVFPPNAHYIFRPTPEGSPGVHGEGRLIVNSLGLRSDEVSSDVQRVVYVMGGSTVIDMYLDQENAWPSVLQRELNGPGRPKIWVGNLGKPGIATRHNIMQFEYMMDALPRPNLIIVLAGANNMQIAIKTSYPEITRDLDLKIAFSETPPPTHGFLAWSRLYRLYQRLNEVQVKRQLGPVMAGDADWMKSIRKCRQATPPDRLVYDVPDLSGALADYRNDLLDIVRRARRLNSDIIIATQPVLWREDMAPDEARLLQTGGLGTLHDWIKCDNMRYYAPETLYAALSRFNAVTLEVCSTGKLRCVDLARELPPSARYYYDDMHFNDAGAAEVARLVANAIDAR